MLMSTETAKIIDFIRGYVRDGETVVVPVSGGLDSDVTARLCCMALGRKRVKLFIVLQSEFEQKFYDQAVKLSKELDIYLTEIHLENINKILIGALEEAEEAGLFRLSTLLDPAKAKCSLRSAVISCYQDKGFLIAGTMNKTEKLLGFFLTFGDNLAHFKPLAHLYKTQVIELAKEIGTAPEVISQEPSAGFWEGQTDAEDLAYWIINEGPILSPRKFSEEEIMLAEKMLPELTVENVDSVLSMYEQGQTMQNVVKRLRIREDIVKGIFAVAEKAPTYKTRKIMVEMEESSF